MAYYREKIQVKRPREEAQRAESRRGPDAELRLSSAWTASVCDNTHGILPARLARASLSRLLLGLSHILFPCLTFNLQSFRGGPDNTGPRAPDINHIVRQVQWPRPSG